MYKKFRDWFAYNPPSAASIDDWEEFDKNFREKAPIRHFLYKTLPQTCVWPMQHRYERLTSWVRYRIVRYHILDTGLDAGYYDKDTLMLNVNFNLLKDFVEIEKAWMQHICTGTEYKMHPILERIPFYKRATFRSRELGLQYLAWEITLDDPSLDKYESCPEQAKTAREILELYKWWVDVRPSRVELEYDEPEDDDAPMLRMFSEKWKAEHSEEVKAFREWSDAHSAQEEAWEREDTEMLIRLISIRKALWT